MGASICVTVAAGFWINKKQEADAIRNDIREAYAKQVAPTLKKLNGFRSNLEERIIEAAQQEPEAYADPRLDLSGLHNAKGLYARFNKVDIESREAIAKKAPSIHLDAITRCLGIAPVSVGGLYSRMDALGEQWSKRVDKAQSVIELRVLADELSTRIKRDLPILLSLATSDYFLLTLQQGDNRRDHPVDVYLWDLHSNKLLLATRTQARGRLIQTRNVYYKGSAPPPKANKKEDPSGGANDCSIAQQITTLVRGS